MNISKCDIRIEMDSVDFNMGGSVSGIVHVEVNRECECKSLMLDKYWVVRRKGLDLLPGKNKTVEHCLFKGIWQPGTYLYLFEFKLDDGPLSYDGKYFNINWFVELRADIPWALDPEDKKAFTVRRRSKSDYKALKDIRDSQQHIIEDKAEPLPPFMRYTISAIFFSGIIAGLISGKMFITLVAFGAAAYLYFKDNKKNLIKQSRGSLRYELNTKVLIPGDQLRLTLSFTPGSDTEIKINMPVVRFFGDEILTVKTGVNSNRPRHRSYFNYLHDDEKNLELKHIPGKAGELRASTVFKVPLDAAPSFNAFNKDINWALKVLVNFSDGTNADQYIPLKILA